MAMSSNDVYDRALGCLLGQAIGDSFGFSYEHRPFPKDALENRPPILGGLGLHPGQVTDDTEMAMALARSICRCQTFDQCDVARSYAHWFYTDPEDIGLTTYQAFRKMPEAKSDMLSLSDEAVRRKLLFASDQLNRPSLSNGCLMRVSPLGIAGYSWPRDNLVASAEADCRLTHPNPIAQDASSTFVCMISTLIRTADRQLALHEAVENCQTSRIRRLLIDQNPVPITVGSDDDADQIVITGDDEMMGYLGVALKWAVCELRNNGDDFSKALISVVARGGDSDTNGAIVGALMGAAVGATKIPEEWKESVIRAKPRNIDYDWSRLEDAEEVVRGLLAANQPIVEMFM